tara:strand:- start:335 stop:508 length:174 start_codon:yes stop_codon:yes gene_type:complete
MNKLNFDDERFWEVSINLKWPHQGFNIGYDLIQADEEVDYNTVLIYLGFLTIMVDFN